MGIWSNLFGQKIDTRAAETTTDEWNPPAPRIAFPVEQRAGGTVMAPADWPGWPDGWGTQWDGPSGFDNLVDTAWTCLDLNASVLATAPVYRVQRDRVVNPTSWMVDPDPEVYSDWSEFANEVFWDFQLGEVFLFATEYANGYPSTMRTIPPWLVTPEWENGLVGGRRIYKIGSLDVTDQIKHIRYRSRTDRLRGIGPLEAGGARMVAARVLSRYVTEIAESGGRPIYWLEVEKRLTKPEADDLLDQWVESRARNLGKPAIVSGGASLENMPIPNAKDMALVELAQFTDARIAVMAGVPPFLVGLPSGGDSMTYSNVSSLFDYHDRASLNPKARRVLSALSNWALPTGEQVEMNRDEYTRPAPLERAQYYTALSEMGAISAPEVRTRERLRGEVSPSALTGGTDA